MKKKFLCLLLASSLFVLMAPAAYAADIDVTVSGIVYSDAGTTPLGDGATITVLVNGVADGTDTLDSGDGAYSIAGVTIDDAADDVVTVYIEDEAEDGNTIAIENDLDITNFDIYTDYLIVKHEGDGTITANEVISGDDGDDDIINDNALGRLIIADDKTLLIDSSATFDVDQIVGIGSLEIEGTLDLTNYNIAFYFSVGGDWTNNGGTFTPATIQILLDGDGNAQAISETTTFGGRIDIQKDGGSVDFTATTNITSSLRILDGGDAPTVDLSADLTAAEIDFDEGSADLDTNTMTLTGNLDIAAGVTIDNGTLEFASDAASTIMTGDIDSINSDISVNITEDAPAEIDMANELVLDAVGQTLTIVEGPFDTAGFDLTATITVEDGGTFKVFGDELITEPTLNTGSTVAFHGDSGAYDIFDWDYHHASFDNDEQYEFPAGVESVGGDLILIDAIVDLDVNLTDFSIGGDLDIQDSSALNSPPGILTISGDLSNADTFDNTDGRVVLDGSTHTITGDFTFHDLTIEDSSDNGTDKILTIEDGSTQTIEGGLTITGIDSSDQVNLVSATPGTAWTIDAQGGTNLEKISVTDSTATTALTCTSCTDGGGNTNWTFASDSTGGGGGNRSGGGGGSSSGGSSSNDADPVVDDSEDEEPEVEEPEEDLEDELTDQEFADMFVDLDVDYWGLSYIKELYLKDIMTGTSEDTMEPKKVLNRAQFLKMLLEAFEYDVPESVTMEEVEELGFSDLTEEDVDKWYMPYIYTAVKEGIIEGYDDGSVKPEEGVSRIEAVIMLSRVMDWDLDELAVEESPFPDVKEDAWYIKELYEAYNRGIVSGYEDGTFGASNELLRGEGAKLIAELI